VFTDICPDEAVIKRFFIPLFFLNYISKFPGIPFFIILPSGLGKELILDLTTVLKGRKSLPTL
jgi:hypothetical protein